MNGKLNNIIPVEFNRKKMAHKARTIAGYLHLALHIQDGNQLVYAIGDGHERNNLAAIASWVQRRLPCHPNKTREAWTIELNKELEQAFSNLSLIITSPNV